MADATYNGLDITPAEYELERAQLWADKSNRIASIGAADARSRCVAEWADDLDNAHRAVQGRLSAAFLNVREFGAVGDDATDDTAAIQAAIAALDEGATLVIPSGVYRCTNLEIEDKTKITIEGPGSIRWTGDDTAGLQLLGACTDVTIRGLQLLGDGSNDHRGVYSTSGQTLVRVVVEDCTIRDCMIGISINADLSGSVRGCVVRHNRIDNVVGTSSGQGYGIHVADGTSGHHGTLIQGNRITRAHRHSIYIARGYGCRCVGNEIDQHREGDSTGSTLGAIMVARGGDHSIADNLISRANNVGLFLDSGSTNGDTLRNVSVRGNVFAAPAGIHPHLYVGEDISPDGDIFDITIQGNTFDASGWNVMAVRVNWGHGVAIIGNAIRLRDVTAATYGVHLIARGESAASATYSSRWIVAHNLIQITNAGGGEASAAIRLVSPFVDLSTVDLLVLGNAAIVPGNAFSVSASIVDPNVTVAQQPITGLTYSSGVAQLGQNAVASALQISGNLTLTGSASVVQVGDATVAGNAQFLRVKGDANNQTSDRWNNGASTLSWAIQHDSSENLNWLNSAASVIGGWQRTGDYWRSAAGFRLGSTTGPLQLSGTGSPETVVTAPVGSTYQRTDGGANTSFYVKESGTGNTGWVAK